MASSRLLGLFKGGEAGERSNELDTQTECPVPALTRGETGLCSVCNLGHLIAWVSSFDKGPDFVSKPTDSLSPPLQQHKSTEAPQHEKEQGGAKDGLPARARTFNSFGFLFGDSHLGLSPARYPDRSEHYGAVVERRVYTSFRLPRSSCCTYCCGALPHEMR